VLPVFHHSMYLRPLAGRITGSSSCTVSSTNCGNQHMDTLCAAHSSCSASSLRRPWRAYLAMMHPDGAQLCALEAADVHFGPGRGQEIERVEGVTSGTSQMLQRVMVHHELRAMPLRSRSNLVLMTSTRSNKSSLQGEHHPHRTLLCSCVYTTRKLCTSASKACVARH